MAENGLVEPASERHVSEGDDALADYVPTRLLPQWTAPRRAPMLGKAVAAEMAHAAGPGTPYGDVGSVVDPVEQPAMIDVVGVELLISPITDENHQADAADKPPLPAALPTSFEEELPESIKEVRRKDNWTTAARIVVHSPDKSDRLPSKLNQLLLSSGATSVENHEVELAVTRDHIRFYHPSDYMHAIEVAAALDGVLDTLLVKDFSFVRPQPPEGLVEIWLR